MRIVIPDMDPSLSSCNKGSDLHPGGMACAVRFLNIYNVSRKRNLCTQQNIFNNNTINEIKIQKFYFLSPSIVAFLLRGVIFFPGILSVFPRQLLLRMCSTRKFSIKTKGTENAYAYKALHIKYIKNLNKKENKLEYKISFEIDFNLCKNVIRNVYKKWHSRSW